MVYFLDFENFKNQFFLKICDLPPYTGKLFKTRLVKLLITKPANKIKKKPRVAGVGISRIWPGIWVLVHFTEKSFRRKN
jgi:hypothetical protein